jgi:hypothetical protein
MITPLLITVVLSPLNLRGGKYPPARLVDVTGDTSPRTSWHTVALTSVLDPARLREGTCGSTRFPATASCKRPLLYTSPLWWRRRLEKHAGLRHGSFPSAISPNEGHQQCARNAVRGPKSVVIFAAAQPTFPLKVEPTDLLSPRYVIPNGPKNRSMVLTGEEPHRSPAGGHLLQLLE